MNNVIDAFENLYNRCNKTVIFGAGEYGRSWAFDLLQAVGFEIIAYYDNKISIGSVIRDSVSVHPINELQEFFDKDSEIIVSIATSDKYQKDILNQLLKMGCKQERILILDKKLLSDLCEYIEKNDDDSLKLKYKNIYDDEIFIKRRFKELMGRELDLLNVESFNEKLQWLKLHDRNPIYTQLVDKYEVKKIVGKIIGDEYIIPTLGVWDTVDDIDISRLPDKFVLKCTHDSGSIVICTDKNKFDFEKAKEKLRKALKTNYFWIGREWPYKNVNPRIIAEPYIEDMVDKELRDYKIYTFGGEPFFMLLTTNRQNGKELCFDYYDMQFNKIPLTNYWHPQSSQDLHKPNKFEDMQDIARKLAKNTYQARTDFYEANGKVYFGEMTFFDKGGYLKIKPTDWEYEWGELIRIPIDLSD